jgi:hypothetical protein
VRWRVGDGRRRGPRCSEPSVNEEVPVACTEVRAVEWPGMAEEGRTGRRTVGLGGLFGGGWFEGRDEAEWVEEGAVAPASRRYSTP